MTIVMYQLLTPVLFSVESTCCDLSLKVYELSQLSLQLPSLCGVSVNVMCIC